MKEIARQVLHGSVALAVAQVVANGASFLMAWAVARGMGSAAYGQFAAAYALATSVAALADSGVRVTLVREVARHMDGWRHLMRHALAISTTLALTVSMGFLAISLLRERLDAQELRLWLLIFALLWTAMRILLGVPAGRHMLASVAWWSALERMGGAMAVGILAFSGCDLVTLARSLCLWEGVVIVFLGWWMLRQDWGAGTATSISLVAFARAAIPFGVAAVIHAVMGRLDLIVLGFRQHPALVGDYAAAQMLAMIAVFVGVSVANALFPALSTLSSSQDVAAARRLLVPAMELVASVMLVIGTVLAWLADDLLKWVYGAGFVPGTPWLVWFALASPLAVVSAMSGAVIGAWGWQGRWARVLVVLLMIAVPAYWLASGAYGVWGAAVVNVGLQVAMAVVAWRWLSGEGLVVNGWLPRLLAVQIILMVFMFLTPAVWHWIGLLLAVVLVLVLRLFRWQWLGDVWRLAR